MEKKVERYIDDLTVLVDFLKGEEFIYIQPHNFPDHDAVASAFGLQQLFKHYGISAHLIYEGEIQRDSLKKLINDLHIDIRHIDDHQVDVHHKIVLVDGCKGNNNVRDLIGDEVGVIDHHQVACPEDVKFSDIRLECGACASIIASYFLDLGVEIPKDVATAIMIGINIATSSLTRGASQQDLKAYFHCSRIADVAYVNSILINHIQISDLEFYRSLIEGIEYFDRLAFCYFPEGCNQNLLGILADFVLSLNEIEFVALCAKNENRVNFSLRNESPEWNASAVIREVLEGIGFGGGHADMAGGMMQDPSAFNKDRILRRIVSILGY